MEVMYGSPYRYFSMANDNSRKFKQNQIIFCIFAWVAEDSILVDFGEDRLRGKGSLPEAFFLVTRVKYFILINKVSVSYTHLDVYKRQV